MNTHDNMTFKYRPIDLRYNFEDKLGDKRACFISMTIIFDTIYFIIRFFNISNTNI